MIGFATIVAGLLEGTVLAIMWLVWDVSMVAAMLLAPYAMWVAFATFLNHRIYRLNR